MVVNSEEMIIFGKYSESAFQNCLKNVPNSKIVENYQKMRQSLKNRRFNYSFTADNGGEREWNEYL